MAGTGGGVGHDADGLKSGGGGLKDDMCGREVRRAVWEGEEWRKRENGGGLEEEGTGEDEEWRRARRRMKNGGGEDEEWRR